MLDPLSAIGLASSIVQFIDLTSRILQTASTLHKGAGKWQESRSELSRLIQSTASSTTALAASLTIENYDNALTGRMLEICEDLRKDAAKLEALDTGTVRRVKFRSFCWVHDGEIEPLRSQVQQQLESLHMYTPTWLQMPGPTTFFVACLCFAAAVTVYHSIHRDSDRYQNHVLAGGVVLAVAVSALAREPFQRIVLTTLPWMCISFLMLSSIGHRLRRWQCMRPRRRGRELLIEEELEDEKAGELHGRHASPIVLF